MNVFRSLARTLSNALEVKGAAQVEPGAKTLNVVREQRVPGVLGLSRFRDGFDLLPQGARVQTLQAERAYHPAMRAVSLHQRDGFDGGRRGPLELSGARAPVAFSASTPPARGFTASIDELAALLG